MSNNNNTTMLWKKRFPMCSFSISKCLPTIANPQSPRHHLSDDDEDRFYQTTNTSSSYNSSSSVSASASVPSSSFTKNFNSLYSSAAAAVEVDGSGETLDLAAAFASKRFFFSSPGESNSIVDQIQQHPQLPGATKTTAASAEKQRREEKRHAARRRRATASFDGGVEVRKYSADPRVDFRRSMQEMIDSRDCNLDDHRSDLEYLHELLLCFLALNPKDTHRHVISAFTDIVVDLLSSENHARRRREVKLRRKRNGLRRTSM